MKRGAMGNRCNEARVFPTNLSYATYKELIPRKIVGNNLNILHPYFPLTS